MSRLYDNRRASARIANLRYLESHQPLCIPLVEQSAAALASSASALLAFSRSGRGYKILFVTTIIEIRPHGGGWQCFEGPGVQPFFGDQPQAIRYAIERSRYYGSGEIRIYNESGSATEIMPFEKIDRRQF